ncbi:MAG: peptidylprolyl isomerase [Cyclobacteriaceae bacterium]
MIRYFLSIAILIFVASVNLYAQKNVDAKATLFTVGSKPVTIEEFVYLYKKNHQGKAEEFTEPKVEEYLGLFVNFKLKVAEAEARKMDMAPEFVSELNSYKEELRKPFVAEPDILDQLVREAYERMKIEVKASHILFTLKPDATPEDTLTAYAKATAARQRALDGEPFEKLARELSEDPSAKSNGGSLGYFSALQMVFQFEEAAYSMERGEVSQPVRTRFGYHLLKVEDKRPSRGEVEVAHILVRNTDADAKKKIDEVYEKLQKDETWEELCTEYSQDPNTKNNGGKLRPFAPGALASAPQFEEVAFALEEPGMVSKPFQTPFGWHIIRLEKKIPLSPFGELEESLKRRVARDDRMNISKAAALEKRKRKLKYNESADLEKTLELFADSSLTKGQWTNKMIEGKSVHELFSLDGVSLSTTDFADYILRRQSPTNVAPSIYVRQLFDQWVDQLLTEAEDVKLQAENPEYKNLVNEYREGILLFAIMEKEIWNQASEDSLGQRNYFESNPEKYKAEMRVEARVFATSDKEFLAEIKSKVTAGDSLTKNDLDKFKSVVRTRSYEKGDNRTIDSINWTVGLHEAEADGMYYLVEVFRLIPPGVKGFSEARANIISDYQDYLEKKWIEQLKKKYPVKINSKNKKKVIKELASVTDF